MSKKTYKDEADFIKRVVKKELDKRELYYFIKEAKSVRGIPDIVGCYRGHFFALEVKKSEREAQKNIERIVLQKYTLRRIDKNGGLGYLVYPENYVEVFEDLDRRCSQTLYSSSSTSI